MIKLDYSKHLKDKNFDFKSEYKKIFTSKFELTKKEKSTTIVRDEFKDDTNQDIFQDSGYKSLEEIYEQFKNKKIDEFDVIFDNKNLEDIFTLKPDEILTMISTHGEKESLNRLKYVFSYDKFQSEITKLFTDNFNFRTCFYCNKDFITNFKKDKNSFVSTFQLDHFFDKATYPYLALSFYNLIPSCPTCNSKKVKGSENCFPACIAPNDKNFAFHEKVKFKLFLEPSCENLHIKGADDIDIPLKEQFSDIYDKYIQIFHLNERYKAHKDIVFEMIKKAELYPESRLKELQNLTGIPFQQIKKDIFNLIDENDDLSKKPFSKLIKDISEELGLI